MFRNLIHLDLLLGLNIQWHSVIEMLNHCPKLEIIMVHMPAEPYFCTNWICPQFGLQCVVSEIKRCNIFNYTGRKSELQFAKYIMKHSRSLQTMTIHSITIGLNYSSSRRKKLEMLQELAMCPKSSPNCKLFLK